MKDSYLPLPWSMDRDSLIHQVFKNSQRCEKDKKHLSHRAKSDGGKNIVQRLDCFHSW